MRKNKSAQSVISESILLITKLFYSFQKEFEKINSKKFFREKYGNLENDIINIIQDIFLKLSVLLKYKTEIKSKPRKVRKPIEALKLPYEQECVICKENRIVNICHIIPGAEGGVYEIENLIFLCPTHHFLFDHSRLSEDEFNKIDLTGKSNTAKEYFEKIHKSKHKMRWKYYTNSFKGCVCGSFDFIFKPHRDGYNIKVCLKCKVCGEIWLNLWEENHPITKAEVDISEEISAEEKIQLFIDEEIPQLLKKC